jgi:predicted metalloprotease with PDZ domain
MRRSVETILAAVKRVPAVNLRLDDAQRSAGVRVGARLVARIGIVFDLTDTEDRSEALAAIRRRVNVERLAPRLRVVSP